MEVTCTYETFWPAVEFLVLSQRVADAPEPSPLAYTKYGYRYGLG